MGEHASLKTFDWHSETFRHGHVLLAGKLVNFNSGQDVDSLNSDWIGRMCCCVAKQCERTIRPLDRAENEKKETLDLYCTVTNTVYELF